MRCAVVENGYIYNSIRIDKQGFFVGWLKIIRNGAMPQQVIGDDQVGHGFADHVDAGDGGNIVAALDGDARGTALGVDGLLGDGHGRDGLDGDAYEDVLAGGDAGEDAARVV